MIDDDDQSGEMVLNSKDAKNAEKLMFFRDLRNLLSKTIDDSEYITRKDLFRYVLFTACQGAIVELKDEDDIEKAFEEEVSRYWEDAKASVKNKKSDKEKEKESLRNMVEALCSAMAKNK